jgi:hypothetical protein
MTAAPDFPIRPSPIERFLGTPEAAGGPFALLGITPRPCTDETVLAALDRQLDRVVEHPECDTPEADEVRLALHAAAAQLLDPNVRRHLVAKWTGIPVAATTTGRLSEPSRVRPRSQLLLEHDAVLTLGLYGGWNERALRRLVALAHARGFTADQVAATLGTLATRRRPGAGVSPHRPMIAGRRRSNGNTAAASRPAPTVRPLTKPAPRPEPVDQAGRFLLMVLMIGVVGVAFTAGAIYLIVRLLTAPAPPPSPPVGVGPPATQGEGSPVGVSKSHPAVPPPSVDRILSPTAKPPSDGGELNAGSLLRELVAHTKYLADDPAAAASQFMVTVERLAQRWPSLPKDGLIAANDAVVEFVYRSGDVGDASRRAVAAIGDGAATLVGETNPAADPAAIDRAVWSLGMLARLSRERDLAATVKGDIDERLAAVLGHSGGLSEPSFDAGGEAAILMLPRIMLSHAPANGVKPWDPRESWARWAGAAASLAGSDRAAAARMILSGLEALLLLGPEPTDDPRVRDVIVALVSRVPWRQGDEARARLLRWFDDPRITPADLHAVTVALATRASAEGVDITMVIPASASDRVRGDLRERYARLWGIGQGVDRAALDADWTRAADQSIARSYAATGGNEHMASTVILARLNESAWRRWRGDAEEAARLLADLADPVDRIVPPGAPSPAPPSETYSGDAAWAERYLAARRAVPQRLELLNRLASQGSLIGPVDAEVLAQEAILGTPAEVRARAVEVAKQFADSASMVNALLELLPKAPRVAATAPLMQYVAQGTLPPVRDPGWPAAVRRALVERSLERVSAEGSLAAIDQLEGLLAVCYRGLASESPLTESDRREKVQPPAAVSAGLVRARWRAEADKTHSTAGSGPRLDQLDRRYAGRASLARGLVQAFAAEQAGAAELMAYVISAERPSRASDISRIMDDLSRTRRGAGSILEQIDAVERAMTQLWRVRFAEGPTS